MNNYEKIKKEIENAKAHYAEKYDTSQTKFYYRGHADIGWDIIPIVKRQEYQDRAEYLYIAEAQKKNLWLPSRSLFENIAYLQHYGIPTRFLDFTTDVDMALFFACSGRKEKDAAIFIFAYDNRPFSSTDSMLIAGSPYFEKRPRSLISQCGLLRNIQNLGNIKIIGKNWERRYYLGLITGLWLNHRKQN